MIFDYKRFFWKLGFRPKGVVVVGAHNGGEVEEYISLGFQRLLLVEANPCLADALRERYSNDRRVSVHSVAISNFNGPTKLHLTNFDQSSSLLPLAKHAEVYPSIHEIAQIDVTAVTLDHLFYANSIDALEFNFLVLDIQGAELLALEGARALLRHIELICCEFNRIEMYNGCALIGDLDNFLEARDFQNYALASPFHESWGDALYVKRPVYTMSSLGSNGGFGNQLFQYLFLRLLSRILNSVFFNPSWIGENIFDIEKSTYIPVLPRAIEKGAICDDRYPGFDARGMIAHSHASLPNSDLWGYFQLHTRTYLPHRHFILDVFKFNAVLENQLCQVTSSLRRDGKKILAVHLRRGDYGYDRFYIAPWTWYRDWMTRNGVSPEEYVIYICSEDPLPFKAKFVGYQCYTRNAFYGDGEPGATEMISIDFGVLVQADILCTSNSTFSIFAALLNQTASTFARPSIDARGLVTFNPWDTNVLEEALLTEMEHRSLFEADSVDSS